MSTILTLLACSMAESWCLKAGLGDENCSDPTLPVEGPWTVAVSTDLPLPACDLRPIDIDDGWVLAPAGPSFTLAPPTSADASAPAECSLDSGTFACASTTGPEGTEVVASGAFASRSQGTIVLDLTAPGCDTQLEAPFLASWTLEASPATCPDIKDDTFAADRSVAEVRITVTNAGTTDLTLFLLAGENPVLAAEAPAGATVTTAARPGNWMMLATGWEQESCVFAFEVVEEGQQATYWGEET
jgi:hypothetical protein